MRFPWWATAAAAVTAFGAMIGMGASGAGAVVFLALSAVGVSTIAHWMRSDADRSWLVGWVSLGFLVKLAGTFARFGMVRYLYGYGDSLSYYRAGVEFAEMWRDGRVPGLSGRGGFGTQVVEWVTGFLFAAFTPDLLGGFMIFAVLAFLGQILLYAAFRRWAEPHHLKPYALMVFLLPTFAFWPSSIGKDSLVMLGLGWSAYATARVLERFELRWVMVLGLGLVGLGAVRLHIAALVIAAAAGAALISKKHPDAGAAASGRRILFVGACAAAALLVLLLLPDLLGFTLEDTRDFEFMTSEVVRRTSERGTVAPGGPVRGPGDLPGALALVLFRPSLLDATEPQHYLAALETTFLAALTLWRLPTLVGRLGRWRSNAYAVFSTLYTVAFAVVFSAVRNLGIIARQRGQVLPMFLAVVILLGWSKAGSSRRSAEPTPVGATDP